ncbi:centromere protein M [Callorhinchus milii]|nr:centromere protein M [Callorhinchus milii]|eukprot:gi/632987151/ref/XP_007910633.1/ PREDICTED: centromere protein M [Callorhinchus milii]
MAALRVCDKHPELNTASLLLVGVDGIPQDQLTEAILEESKSFTVNVRLAKKLPLPTENEESRPRIDLIVFLLDVRNQYSIEITKSSLAYVDVNFFLGKVCFLAVIDKSIKHQVVEMHAVKELADSYSSPLFFVELASPERRTGIAQRLLRMLKVAAGLVPGVSALALSSLLRPSFKTQAKRC